ncbi:AraC family transcriptional regulator [Candidatus Avoscillospira sp. LCP25S3_F1]|uniref:AraC family transcriptional regulator n=1 Tax=Candidatus Avoscillospira sp. LCP25S3_F1 TaxID=3438825 RepID=UPI003F8FCDA7
MDYYEFKKAWIYPESYIPYSMLRYVVRGSGIFIIDDKQYEVKENQVCYIPEGCRLSCYATGNELVFFSIRFTTTVRINDKDLLTDFYHLQPVLNDTDQIIQQRFAEIYSYAKGDSIAKLFRIRGNLELLIAWVVEQAHAHTECDGTSDGCCASAGSPQENVPEWTWDSSLEASCHRAKKTNRIKRDSRIKMVVDHLVANPSRPFDTKYFCEITGLSDSSLRRLFKEHTGKTPFDFMKELRMVTAARRLLVTNKRVSTIAYELGYNDQNYFARVFKSVFGISPDRYRKEARK